MSANLNLGSARIYQFPAGGRAALGGRSYHEAKSVSEAPRVNEATCSGSWYHDEAIREAQSQTKPWER
jgi:Protein of unknown function (DUF2735)